MNDTTIIKICTICNKEKQITEFRKRNEIKSGYRNQCKECLNASPIAKARREANKEKIGANTKAWYAANKERHAKSVNSWYESHKEERAEYNKNWRKENPVITRVQDRNKRARKKNAIGTHTASDIRQILSLQKSKCAVCKTKLSSGYHVDHVIALVNGGSNDKYNLQILCQPCNNSKHAKDPIYFMQSRGFLL